MSSTSDRAYVWTWLPGRVDPVPAGLLRATVDRRLAFAYGERYLDRADAVPLYGLPLRSGYVDPPDGWSVPPAVADASPGRWGRRVIMDRLLHRTGGGGPTDGPDALTVLLESGSDRAGALDFQHSAEHYVARGATTSLADAYRAAWALESGQTLPDELRDALTSSTGLGGSRPKVALRVQGREMIATFARPDDLVPVVRAEGLAIELARRAGLDVPLSMVTRAAGRDVLLVHRFDRSDDGARRTVVSALTLSGEPEAGAHLVTYGMLRDALLRQGDDPRSSARLFERIAFRMLVGSADDHARNHAVFWDGRRLELTPAFGLRPSARAGADAAPVLAYTDAGDRTPRVTALVRAAHEYGLTRREADEIVDRLVATVHDEWDDAADTARLTQAERDFLHGRQFLDPDVLDRHPGTRAASTAPSAFEANHSRASR